MTASGTLLKHNKRGNVNVCDGANRKLYSHKDLLVSPAELVLWFLSATGSFQQHKPHRPERRDREPESRTGTSAPEVHTAEGQTWTHNIRPAQQRRSEHWTHLSDEGGDHSSDPTERRSETHPQGSSRRRVHLREITCQLINDHLTTRELINSSIRTSAV